MDGGNRLGGRHSPEKFAVLSGELVVHGRLACRTARARSRALVIPFIFLIIRAQDEAARDAAEAGAKMTLFDLLCVGIGGTVGSGVFVLTGQVKAKLSPTTTLII